ncbi:CDP-alcohol phosphatidyltransferase family protein [Pontimicrobium sp. SW4]|uniref:CDP-alcohol phosphatidyltransferase family protein n=1 Tax=Pontimicrobium sp. SW4 TaxID=3153519 RepID=A0AAU7BVN1_9FLAO
MIKHIPNFVTLLNLFCGSIAVIFAVNGSLVTASFFAFMGIFFDFFDGFLARKLNAQSELGLQLDSLADMVTSGLLPGIVMFQLLDMSSSSWSSLGLNKTVGYAVDLPELSTFLPLIGLLITLASAYRLANFNIDENQTDSFIGLPTPANTLLILSFPLIMEFQDNDMMNSIILNKWFLILITLVSCYLLNANIKLLALKFKTWNFQDNAARYLLIVLAAVLLIVFQFAAIPLIILAYIIISVLNKKQP